MCHFRHARPLDVQLLAEVQRDRLPIFEHLRVINEGAPPLPCVAFGVEQMP
jgi:hypothetical protein